jgi:hypothetical protein
MSALLSVILLGFFLGMRHATDSDLATASGVLSLALGLFLAYQVGFVDGLFTDQPRWTPE